MDQKHYQPKSNLNHNLFNLLEINLELLGDTGNSNKDLNNSTFSQINSSAGILGNVESLNVDIGNLQNHNLMKSEVTENLHLDIYSERSNSKNHFSTQNQSLKAKTYERVIVKKERDCDMIKSEPGFKNFYKHETICTNMLLTENNIRESLVDNSCSEIDVIENFIEVDIKPKIKEELQDEVDIKMINSFEESIIKQKQSVYNTLAIKREPEYDDNTLLTGAGDLLVPNLHLTYRGQSPIGELMNKSGSPSPRKRGRPRKNRSLATNNMVEIVTKHNIIKKLKNKTTKATKKKDVAKKLFIANDDMQNLQKEPELSCSKCDYKTWDKTYMVLHAQFHEKEGNNISTCNICDFVTKDKEMLTKHYIKHNGKAPFKCYLCDFQCVAPSILIKHANFHHPEINKPFMCNVCGYKSANNSDIIRHTRTHTGEKPFSCKQCSYRCTDISSLTFHMRTHTGEKPYSCDMCEYRAKCNSALTSHMRRHTGERPYNCKSCDYNFANKSDLVRHMKVNAGEHFSCSVCEFNTPAKCALIKHLRIHNIVEVFNCILCSFQCSRHCYLLKHMRSHNGKDMYKCKSCEFTCDTYVKYTRHVHTTGELKLSCDICLYTCNGKQLLKTHMKTHNQTEQHYFCPKCDYKCLIKRDLVVHEREAHVVVKPYSCALCKYTCKNIRTLKYHMQKTHAGKSEVELII